MSTAEKNNEKMKSSRAMSNSNTTKAPEQQLKSQGTLFKQPEPVQTIASVKMLFRHFVSDDIIKKIQLIDERIEATSKFLSTKEKLNNKCSQELHYFNKIMKQCSDK